MPKPQGNSVVIMAKEPTAESKINRASPSFKEVYPLKEPQFCVFR